jgi:hypothetical protein
LSEEGEDVRNVLKPEPKLFVSNFSKLSNPLRLGRNLSQAGLMWGRP